MRVLIGTPSINKEFPNREFEHEFYKPKRAIKIIKRLLVPFGLLKYIKLFFLVIFLFPPNLLSESFLNLGRIYYLPFRALKKKNDKVMEATATFVTHLSR